MTVSLFGSLRVASESMNAYRAALDIVGQDIANVGTPGHVQRSPVMVAQEMSLGGGVRSGGIMVARNETLESTYRRELSSRTAAETEASALRLLDSYFGAGIEDSLSQRLQSVFDALSRASVMGGNEFARRDVIQALDGWTSAMRDAANQVDLERTRADQAAATRVAGINALLTRIADLNVRLHDAPDDGVRQPLLDQLTSTLADLSREVDITTRVADGGGRVVSLSSGTVLVGDRDAFQLETRPSAVANGLHEFWVAGASGIAREVTAEIRGGILGGWLAARDGAAKDIQARLDEIAGGVADELDRVHALGFDATGAPGAALLAPRPLGPGTPGAARSLAVSPSLLADARGLALASSPGGGLGNLSALSNVRQALLFGAGTTTSLGALDAIGSSIGIAAADADAAAQQHGVLEDEAVARRDEMLATDLASSAVDLVRYQRGLEAVAGYFRAIDETLDSIFSLIR